ncbi:MAG: TonB-dependent receptor, partial [Bacteroidota bacterium]|nr:TonB-dependent receptor [Bacteroidota bacterium]
FAVTVLQSEKMVGKKGYGLAEVLSSVPGVLAQSRVGNQDVRITIRGFGARGSGDRSNAGTSRGIRIMQDGFPETEPDGRTSFDLIDLNMVNNIEIIRSNASSLWGNASGGLVNISSIPNNRNSFIEISGSTGSFGYLNTNIKTNYKLAKGQMFASFSNTKFDGWRDHSRSSRMMFNFGVLSALDDFTSLGVFLSATSNSFHIPGPLTQAQFDTDSKQANATYLANDERRFNRLGRLGLSIEHFINEDNSVSASVFVNPKFLQRSERGTFRDFTRYHFGGNVLYKNSTNFGDLNNYLSVGADESYQDGAILFYNLLAPYNQRGTLKDNKSEGANSFGTFIQDELVINNLSLIVGGRYDNIKYYNQSFLTSPTRTDSKEYTKFTPKAAVSYSFSNLHSVYFNYGGGIEVPAGNETDPAGTYGQDTVYLLNPLLEPMTSTTFEIGTKHIVPLDLTVLDFVSYDLALYYIDVKNDLVSYQGGKFYFNAAKTNRKGMELGITLHSKYDLTLEGSFTYSMNKYKDYIVDSVHYSKPGKYADFKDNKMAGLPDVFYNTTLTYSPSFLSGLYVSVNMNGVGKYFVDDANTINVPAYNIINASLGFNEFDITNHLYLKGFLSVNNITDKKYAASAFINPDKQKKTNAPMFLEAGSPRNIILSISVGIK